MSPLILSLTTVSVREMASEKLATDNEMLILCNPGSSSVLLNSMVKINSISEGPSTCLDRTTAELQFREIIKIKKIRKV